jgi:hypothetical protein
LGNLIPDVDQINVLPLFQKSHPNVKWVGIIGCQSNGFIKTLKSINKNDPVFYASEGLVFPLSALKNAIQSYKSRSNQNKLERKKRLQCQTSYKEGHIISFVNPSNHQSVQIFRNGIFVTLLSPYLENRAELFVEYEDFMRFTVDSGLKLINSRLIDLPLVEISGNGFELTSPTLHGKRIGKVHNYQAGNIPLSTDKRTVKSCKY